MGGSESLLRDVDDGIMTLTINRPESLNCFDLSLLSLFNATLGEIEFDRSVRVVIITGSTSGKNAFSTGADLKERAGMSPDQVRLYIQTIRNLFSTWKSYPSLLLRL